MIRGPYQRRKEFWVTPYEERYKRSAPGGFLHIYNRGVGGQNIFNEKDDYEYYLEKLKRVQEEKNITTLAYCLMPNHIHLLLHQVGEEGISPFVSSLHTSYAKIFNGKYGHFGHLFQGRFKQVIIQRDEHLQYLVVYIHLNPVEAGLVAHPKNYPWSSWKAYARGATELPCNPDILLEIFDGRKKYLEVEKDILNWKKSKRWDKIKNYTIE